jgi:hypothetical protein
MRTTSVAITYIPRPKVAIRIIFCFLGNCIAVKTGIGKIRMAMSVITFTGAEAKYNVIRGIHVPMGAKTWETGTHWKTLKNVKTRPAMLTTARVTHDATRSSLWALRDRRKYRIRIEDFAAIKQGF